MNIALGTVASTSENFLQKYLKFSNALKREFNVDSFIFEHDSKDKTKNLLKDISDYYISEDLGIDNNQNLENLTLKCNLRNKLKDSIFNTKDYEVVISTDIDIFTWPSIESIKSNIEKIQKEPKIGAITSLGLSYYNGNIVYYDIASLVINKKIQNHKIWLDSDIKDNMEVDSAFGGFVIYYGPAIKTIKYQPLLLEGYPCPYHSNPRYTTEHCSLNMELRKQNLLVTIDKNQVLYK